MMCSDVTDSIVITRRHVVGIFRANKYGVKMRKSETRQPRLLADHIFRLARNSTHNSLQALRSLRHYAAATFVPPTWRR